MKPKGQFNSIINNNYIMKKTTNTRKATPRKNRRRTQILTQERLREKVEAYILDEQKLLEKHGLAKRLVISFPYHRNPNKVPLRGRIAQILLTWSRGVLDTQFGINK